MLAIHKLMPQSTQLQESTTFKSLPAVGVGSDDTPKQCAKSNKELDMIKPSVPCLASEEARCDKCARDVADTRSFNKPFYPIGERKRTVLGTVCDGHHLGMGRGNK